MKLYYAPGACSLAVHIAIAYLDRVSQRPRVQDALRAEGLVK